MTISVTKNPKSQILIPSKKKKNLVFGLQTSASTHILSSQNPKDCFHKDRMQCYEDTGTGPVY